MGNGNLYYTVNFFHPDIAFCMVIEGRHTFQQILGKPQFKQKPCLFLSSVLLKLYALSRDSSVGIATGSSPGIHVVQTEGSFTGGKTAEA
jgi:hypothetical protein